MRKIRFYRRLLIELIETMCTICLYLQRDSMHMHPDGRRFASYFASHFDALKGYSETLREKEYKRRKEK